MAIFPHDCPHCGVVKSGFALFSAHIFKHDTIGNGIFSIDSAFAAFCPSCEMPICGKLKGNFRKSSLHSQIIQDILGRQENLEKMGLIVCEVFPEQKQAKSPEHCPAPIEKAFIQAEKLFVMSGQEEPSATMYRKSIDLSFKYKLGESATNNLNKNIKFAEQNGIITPQMEEWSHVVRLGGNEGAHDFTDMTKEQLIETRAFAEAFLTYVWTLPTRVAEHKEKAVSDISKIEN